MSDLLSNVREFFFDAMRNGYAAKVEKIGIPHMNHKGIPYKSRDGQFYLIYAYCVNTLTSYSAGTTTIFHKDQPVWWVNYVGRYQPGSTKYLKEALKSAYDRNLFCGGRGPVECRTSDGYTYKNHLEINSFQLFSGKEKLLDPAGNMVGFHEYSGRELAPLG